MYQYRIYKCEVLFHTDVGYWGRDTYFLSFCFRCLALPFYRCLATNCGNLGPLNLWGPVFPNRLNIAKYGRDRNSNWRRRFCYLWHKTVCVMISAFLWPRRPTLSAKAIRFQAVPLSRTTFRPFVRPIDRSHMVITMSRERLNNFDKTDRQYSLDPIDDQISKMQRHPWQSRSIFCFSVWYVVVVQ